MSFIFFRTVTVISAMAIASMLHAADARYPVRQVQKIDIIEPSGGSSWEDKNWLDCNDVILTEEDVRYALQHMRKISEKHYFGEYMERTGCSGGASVKFKSGKIIVMGIEPTGRINLFEANKSWTLLEYLEASTTANPATNARWTCCRTPWTAQPNDGSRS